MRIVFVVLHGQQRVGVIDPKGFGHLTERTIGIATVRVCGIEGRC